jgi:Asp-tRNA(Asn)/Glu-tRNA(Gln) amidotransferase A subunit family amidase
MLSGEAHHRNAHIATPPHSSGIFGLPEFAVSAVSCPLEPFFTHLFNLSGQPAASIPVVFTEDGLPVRLQNVGHRFSEKSVLRASARFEAARP